LFATENGPQCDDEINLIVRGQNYGWGIVKDYNTETYCNIPNRTAASVPPLINFTPVIAPTGILIYDGETFPQWRGQLFFCSFLKVQLLRVELNTERTAFASDPAVVPTGPQPGCAVEVAQGPDGSIYYSGITGIYRIVPLDD
jgi:glucose/arabinose dehydrogenase